MIIDELNNLIKYGDIYWDENEDIDPSDIEDIIYWRDIGSDEEEEDEPYNPDEDEEGEDEPYVPDIPEDKPYEQGIITRDVAEYDRKIDLLRAYVGYYTEEDLEEMFDTSSLVTILVKYSYSQIRARLVNTKTNTLEEDFDIGDIVEINKPVLRDNIYIHDDGMIIGKHLVFDDKDRNRSPIYHTMYDILVQSEQFIDGFSYEIKREVARDLILKEYTIDDVESIMNEFASYQIEKNV